MVDEDLEKAMDELDEAAGKDTETAHVDADDALIKFLNAKGYKELAEKYQNMTTDFWYA